MSGGRSVLTIAFDDASEIETSCATVAELKAWLDERLGIADSQMVALLFTRMALERLTTVAQVNAHAGKRATLDLGKDFLGANAIVRVV
jgi:uncharacterized protein with PIN domain